MGARLPPIFDPEYVGAKDRAREAKRGLWRGGFVAPWDWRQGERLAVAAEAGWRHVLAHHKDVERAVLFGHHVALDPTHFIFHLVITNRGTAWTALALVYDCGRGGR